MILGGGISGVFGSLLGLGGGILIIPLLTLVFHLPIHQAIGTSLVSVIATSTGAASVYVKSKKVDIKLGMSLELATTIGAIIGGLIAGLISQKGLSILFSGLLLYTAFVMARKREKVETEELNVGDSSYKIVNLPLGMTASFFAGNISGLLGVGGGIIKVPAMHLLMKVPLKIATATSNFMIGVTATASAFIYYFRGDVNILVTGIITLGVFIGAFFGSRIAPKIKTKHLKLGFVFVLLYLSLKMLFGAVNIHFLIF